jgi:hypothetical protein
MGRTKWLLSSHYMPNIVCGTDGRENTATKSSIVACVLVYRALSLQKQGSYRGTLITGS